MPSLPPVAPDAQPTPREALTALRDEDYLFHDGEWWVRSTAVRAAVDANAEKTGPLREWRKGGLYRAALINAIAHYDGPADDTIPVLNSWLRRADRIGGAQ